MEGVTYHPYRRTSRRNPNPTLPNFPTRDYLPDRAVSEAGSESHGSSVTTSSLLSHSLRDTYFGSPGGTLYPDPNFYTPLHRPRGPRSTHSDQSKGKRVQTTPFISQGPAPTRFVGSEFAEPYPTCDYRTWARACGFFNTPRIPTDDGSPVYGTSQPIESPIPEWSPGFQHLRHPNLVTIGVAREYDRCAGATTTRTPSNNRQKYNLSI